MALQRPAPEDALRITYYVFEFSGSSENSGAGGFDAQDRIEPWITITPADTAVPEPFTLSILAAGLIGTAAMRRRQAKRA